jgi:predicted MarR family transcription regulator
MAFAFCARWRRVRSPILFDSLARIRRMQSAMRDIMASLSLPAGGHDFAQNGDSPSALDARGTEKEVHPCVY